MEGCRTTLLVTRALISMPTPPGIKYLHPYRLSYTGLRRTWSLSQGPRSTRCRTHWTGRQPIARHKNTHVHTLQTIRKCQSAYSTGQVFWTEGANMHTGQKQESIPQAWRHQGRVRLTRMSIFLHIIKIFKKNTSPLHWQPLCPALNFQLHHSVSSCTRKPD